MNQDTISFQQLYSRYAEDVYRFSFWLTGDADEAKDITSETFARVWTAKTEPRIESVKAYLFAIARNLWLHDKRRKKKLVSFDDEIHGATAQPDRIIEAKFDLDIVQKALQTLPEIDRAIFIMKIEDELSYEDIACATGLSVANVKVKVFRASAKIHSLITMKQGE